VPVGIVVSVRVQRRRNGDEIRSLTAPANKVVCGASTRDQVTEVINQRNQRRVLLADGGQRRHRQRWSDRSPAEKYGETKKIKNIT